MSTTEKDEIIGAAYARLEGALAPPLDGQQRIAHRIAVRRRGRRVARAGVVVVVVAGVAGGVAIARSGDDPSGTIAVEQPPPAVSTLVLTRPDGSTYSFDDVTVTCEKPAWDESGSTGRIWAYSPRDLEGDHFTRPFLYFQGTVDELQGGLAATVPLAGPDDYEPGPLVLFMADAPADGRPANETSSSASGAGTIRVVEAACTPTPVLRLEVDATLGTEMRHGDDLAVAGTLE
jgi:hypothetical protein